MADYQEAVTEKLAIPAAFILKIMTVFYLALKKRNPQIRSQAQGGENHSHHAFEDDIEEEVFFVFTSFYYSFVKKIYYRHKAMFASIFLFFSRLSGQDSKPYPKSHFTLLPSTNNFCYY